TGFSERAKVARRGAEQGPRFPGMRPGSVSRRVVRDGARSRCVAYVFTSRGRALLPHPAAHTESQRHPRWRAAADTVILVLVMSIQRPRPAFRLPPSSVILPR